MGTIHVLHFCNQRIGNSSTAPGSFGVLTIDSVRKRFVIIIKHGRRLMAGGRWRETERGWWIDNQVHGSRNVSYEKLQLHLLPFAFVIFVCMDQ